MLKILKYLLYVFLSIILKLRQLDNHEQQILINNLPAGYSRYQYGFFYRCVRLAAILIICSTWYHIWIIKIITNLCNKYDIKILFTISIDKYLSFYGFLVMLCIGFLFLHCLFNVLIRIIFFKHIVKNSPISVTQCISTGFKICRYSAGFTGILLGVPGIDYVFERNGQIPPLRGFYMERQIKFFGANEVNCAITEGTKLSKEGIIRRGLSILQDHTQNKEKIANTAFINTEPGSNPTETVILALKQKVT